MRELSLYAKSPTPPPLTPVTSLHTELHTDAVDAEDNALVTLYNSHTKNSPSESDSSSSSGESYVVLMSARRRRHAHHARRRVIVDVSSSETEDDYAAQVTTVCGDGDSRGADEMSDMCVF